MRKEKERKREVERQSANVEANIVNFNIINTQAGSNSIKLQRVEK